jgi:hypothetical protein
MIAFEGMNMMKRFVLLLFVILFLFTAVGCNGSSDDSRNYKYIEIDGGYEIWASSNYEGVLTIPENYKDLPVLEIDFFDSSNSRNVTKIIGSKNLISINAWCFSGRDQKSMDNLTEVIFPENGELKKIETMAFYWQTSLKTVVLPDKIEYLGDGIFERCFALENLVIYNPIPPIMDGDIFNWDTTLINDEYWHTKPNKNFTVFVPDEAVHTYQQSPWNKFAINPISEANFIS